MKIYDYYTLFSILVVSLLFYAANKVLIFDPLDLAYMCVPRIYTTWPFQVQLSHEFLYVAQFEFAATQHRIVLYRLISSENANLVSVLQALHVSQASIDVLWVQFSCKGFIGLLICLSTTDEP